MGGAGGGGGRDGAGGGEVALGDDAGDRVVGSQWRGDDVRAAASDDVGEVARREDVTGRDDATGAGRARLRDGVADADAGSRREGDRDGRVEVGPQQVGHAGDVDGCRGVARSRGREHDGVALRQPRLVQAGREQLGQQGVRSKRRGRRRAAPGIRHRAGDVDLRVEPGRQEQGHDDGGSRRDGADDVVDLGLLHVDEGLFDRDVRQQQAHLLDGCGDGGAAVGRAGPVRASDEDGSHAGPSGEATSSRYPRLWGAAVSAANQ